MDNIRKSLGEKERKALEEAEQYFDRLDQDFEEPWRVKFTGIVGAFEALYQYKTHSVIFNDAETPDEEIGTAFIHENMHQRHATQAFGPVTTEFKDQLDQAEESHRNMGREAKDQGLNPIFISELGDMNFLPEDELAAAANYHNGKSVEQILDEYAVSELAEVEDDSIIEETFPELIERGEKLEDGAWVASSEVVANFVDYHHSGWLDELPKKVIRAEVANTIGQYDASEFQYSENQLVEYGVEQVNALASLYEKMSGTDLEDKLVGRIVSATDTMFEEYENWEGLPSIKGYVKDELNLN